MEGFCHTERPKFFHPEFQATACILETENEQVLFLLRSSYPFKWGLPWGKLVSGESSSVVALERTKEVTGIELEAYRMQLVAKLYVQHPECNFIFDMYRHIIRQQTGILCDNDKYQDCRWMRPWDAIVNLPLMEGLYDCLGFIYG